MSPIDPAELWAFLDGELPAGRAEEVRAALAQDAALRRSYEVLVAREADWSGRAAAARFRPRVRVDRAPFAGRYLTAAAVVSGLLLLRMTSKALPLLYGVGLEGLLLALVVGWGLRRIMKATDVDYMGAVMPTDC